MIYTTELYHHGVVGQKWRVRHGPPYPLSSEVSTGHKLKTEYGGKKVGLGEGIRLYKKKKLQEKNAKIRAKNAELNKKKKQVEENLRLKKRQAELKDREKELKDKTREAKEELKKPISEISKENQANKEVNNLSTKIADAITKNDGAEIQRLINDYYSKQTPQNPQQNQQQNYNQNQQNQKPQNQQQNQYNQNKYDDLHIEQKYPTTKKLSRKQISKMTNEELRAYSERIRMEKSLQDLSKETINAGKEEAKKIIGNVAKDIAVTTAKDVGIWAAKNAGKALIQHALGVQLSKDDPTYKEPSLAESMLAEIANTSLYTQTRGIEGGKGGKKKNKNGDQQQQGNGSPMDMISAMAKAAQKMQSQQSGDNKQSKKDKDTIQKEGKEAVDRILNSVEPKKSDSVPKQENVTKADIMKNVSNSDLKKALKGDDKSKAQVVQEILSAAPKTTAARDEISELLSSINKTSNVVDNYTNSLLNKNANIPRQVQELLDNPKSTIVTDPAELERLFRERNK